MDLIDFNTHKEELMLNTEELKLEEKRFEELFAKCPPNSPWIGEPHREEFKHAGLDCLMQRGPWGAWCGYVAVKPGHPAYKVDYSNEVVNEIEVHGGLTYSKECGGTICHVPAPGEPDNVWWFGFDCSHCFDKTPYEEANLPVSPLRDKHYRDINYTREEVKRLAEQLSRLKGAA